MKIPLILAQEPAAAPTSLPQAHVPQESALGEIGRSLVEVSGRLIRERRALEVKSQLQSARAEFELGLATMESDLRLIERDPNAYPQKWEHLARQIQQRVSNGIGDEEVRGLFNAAAPGLLLNNQVAVLKHRNALFVDQQTGQLVKTLDQRKILAGLTSLDRPEEFTRQYREALDAIAGQEPIIGAKAAEELRIKTRQDFLEERALRHRDADPGNFLDELGTTYAGMDPKTRDRFAEVAQKNLDRAQEQHRREFERSMKEQTEEAERRMLDIIGDPKATAAERTARLNDFRELQLLSSEKIQQFDTLIASGFARKPSDPMVKIGVDRLLFQADPQITHAELDRLAQEHARGRPGLNPAEYASAKQYLAARDREKEAGDPYLVRAQAQAEQRIRESIGMTSPLDQLEPENKKLLDMAMEQLTNRSSLFQKSKGGTEDPLRVADEIIPVLQQARMMDIGVGKSTLQRWASALQAAKDAGEISEVTYRTQRAQIERRFKDLERRQQLMPVPQPGAGAAPKQPGIFQKQTGK